MDPEAKEREQFTEKLPPLLLKRVINMYTGGTGTLAPHSLGSIVRATAESYFKDKQAFMENLESEEQRRREAAYVDMVRAQAQEWGGGWGSAQSLQEDCWARGHRGEAVPTEMTQETAADVATALSAPGAGTGAGAGGSAMDVDG